MMEVGTWEYQKMRGHGERKSTTSMRHHLHFDGKDNEAVTCTFFTDGLRAEKGQAKDMAQRLTRALFPAALLLTWAWS